MMRTILKSHKWLVALSSHFFQEECWVLSDYHYDTIIIENPKNIHSIITTGKIDFTYIAMNVHSISGPQRSPEAVKKDSWIRIRMRIIFHTIYLLLKSYRSLTKIQYHKNTFMTEILPLWKKCCLYVLGNLSTYHSNNEIV